MYKEFFGLDDIPFTLTPDPRFIVFTPSYNEVLASLYYGLENAKGLIVLTGEVGTGKTTALRWILRRLDSSVLAAYVFNPRLSIDEFYQHVTQMLGIKDWTNKCELLTIMGKVLEERHRRGLRTVIIIDEAHELSDYVLEEIRLLAQFRVRQCQASADRPDRPARASREAESDESAAVQTACRTAVQHASVSECRGGRPLHHRAAADRGFGSAEHLHAGGGRFHLPMLRGHSANINNLCDNAMLAAYSDGEQIISRQIIEEVAENLDMLPRNDILQRQTAYDDRSERSCLAVRSAAEDIWNGERAHGSGEAPSIHGTTRSSRTAAQTVTQTVIPTDIRVRDQAELHSNGPGTEDDAKPRYWRAFLQVLTNGTSTDTKRSI